jgi:protein PhnA
MKDLPNCVKCGSKYTYQDGNLYICPECAYEWTEDLDVKEEKSEPEETVVKDAYGNVLKDGDSVTIIQDIKVKGSSSVIKVGVKVKDIRIVDEVNGHNIDAKVPGFGAMMLKSKIVKKCN